MARNWTVQIQGGHPDRPATSYAALDALPTTLRPCDANNGGGLDDLASDLFVLWYEIYEEV